MIQNPAELKEKIIQFIKINGPNIPVRIASNVGQSILFTSAFLSELMAEKRLKQSYMRIGSSPIYLLPGQEPQLEKFTEHIQGKEKEALLQLKEYKFLEDTKLEPAIRVALRSIKDFAIPFKKDNILFWRYFTVPESEFEIPEIPQKKEELIQGKPTEIVEPTPLVKEQEASEINTLQTTIIEKTTLPEKQTEELNIFDKSQTKKETQKKTRIKKTPAKKTPSATQKKNDKFFNKIKEFLASKDIEITDIEGFSKDDLVLKVKENGEEKMLIAYNKKSLKEDDIVKAHKKASDSGLKYIVLTLGTPLKRLATLIEAINQLSSIQQVQD